MGFDGYPPSTGQDIQLWYFLSQIPYALKERREIGGGFWPSPIQPISWASGIASSVTLNPNGSITFSTDNVNNWPVETDCCTGGFENRQCTKDGCKCKPTYIPIHYDVIFQADRKDPWKTVRGLITATAVNGSTGTITFEGRNTVDAITSGFIDSVSVLEGLRFYVIKRNAPWWTDRFPEKPNEQEAWLASGYGGSAHFVVSSNDDLSTEGPLYSTLQDPNPKTSWKVDEWIGYEVLVEGNGLLRRLAVVRNNNNTLYFAPNSYSVGGTFSIILAGRKGDPRRTRWKPFQAYYGAAESVLSHTADDLIGGATKPIYSTKWRSGNPCFGVECEDETHTVFDGPPENEAQKPWDSEAICVGQQAGDLIAPNLYKSIRSWQNDIVVLCGQFIALDWTVGTERPPEYLTPAKLFSLIGVNNGSSSLSWQMTATDENGNQSGYYYFTASAWIGKRLYWTLYDRKGNVRANGQDTVSEDGRCGQIGGNHNNGNSPNDDGLSVIFSAGWTRYVPYWFKFFYSKESFRPDTYSPSEGAEPIVADPPVALIDEETGKYTCEGVGAYLKRDKSTGGVVIDLNGNALDSAMAFEVGKLYRYVGENKWEGTLAGYSSDDLLITYYDKWFRGKYSPVNQAARDASRRGASTSVTAHSLTDSNKSWWNDFQNGGVLRTQSGTATSGSTSHLTDNTKDVTDEFSDVGCWFNPLRFSTEEPYVGFILEVTKGNKTFKTPITSVVTSSGGITFEFAEVDGLTVANGDSYAIREPKYERNKWLGRTVKISTASGTVERVITANDNTTFWFDEAITFDATPDEEGVVGKGLAYQIIEEPWGTVWRWDGSKMVKPEGMDSVRLGVFEPADFHKNATENLESFRKDYGPLWVGDAITSTLFKEVFEAINQLQWTAKDIGWTNRSNPSTAEPNSLYCPGVFNNPYWDTYNTTTSEYYPGVHGPYTSFEQAKNNAYGYYYTYQYKTAHNFNKTEQGGSPFAYVNYGVGMSYYSGGDGNASRPGAGEGGGISPWQLYAQYAYPTVGWLGGMAQTPCEVNFVGKGLIDLADHEQGTTTTETQSDPHSGLPSKTTIAYTFQALGTNGVEYRKFGTFATVMAPSTAPTNNTILGPKVGDVDSVTTPDPVKPTPPSSISNHPTVLNAFTQGTTGYVLVETTAILKWQFEYVG